VFKFIQNKFTLDENNKLILTNVLYTLIFKGGSLIISLFTFPAYIRYLGNEQILGAWFTILSILNLVFSFDLGIGNGLRNMLVPVLLDGDQKKVKKYISTAYTIIGFIVLICIILGCFTFKNVHFSSFFKIKENIVSQKTLYYTVLIAFSGIMMQFFLNLITSIMYAMQKSAFINLLALISSLINLLFVSFTKCSNLSSGLISLAFVNVLSVNIPLILATILIFSKKLKGCSPSFYQFDIEFARNILKLGGIFFWVQIVFMFITSTNEILIVWLTNAQMVVEYQAYSKLFMLGGTIFVLVLSPVWSVVTKAMFEKKYAWLKKIHKIMNLVFILAVIFELLIMIFLQKLFNVWLGEEAIQVNYFYACIFTAFGSLFIWNAMQSSIANGLGKPKIEAIFLTIGAFIKIPLSIVFVNLFGSWIGVIFANVISIMAYSIVQPIWIGRFLNKLEIEEVKI